MATEPRTSIADLSDDKLVRELEAMMILALGTHSLGGQRRMACQNAEQWTQVTCADHAAGGLCRRPGIAIEPFDQRRLADWATA